jgi:hypothetical protein
MDTRTRISRRKFFSSTAILAGGMAGLGASTRTASAAVPQEAAGYQGKDNNGQSCSSCAHFTPPSSCAVVAGIISPGGWCKLYAKK